MNKKSRKAKGLFRRLIVLLLCCVCLMGIAPTSAIALEADATSAVEETPTEESTEEVVVVPEATATPAPTTPSDLENATVDQDSPEPETIVEPESTIEPTPEAEPEETKAPQSFYDEVMAAQSCQAMYELISDDANYDKASALTVEQVYAIREYAQSLEDDGYQEILVQTLNELLKYLGEDIDSEYGTELDGELNQSMYKGSVKVYWDTITSLSQSASSARGVNVEEVTLGGSSVTQGYSKSTSWSGGSKLSTYFPEAAVNRMTNATMAITAKTGYYVTGIVVACAPTPPNGTLDPFHCGTWNSGNEYIQNFSLANSTYSDGKYTLSLNVNSLYFSHDGASAPAAYFILITTAKVPTPLYVEYNYGNVTDFLTVDSNSAFYQPTWTVASSENNYGSGSIFTANTQFAYRYPDNDISVIANWTHKANSISEAAVAEAAAKGYQFAGWSVTWYNDCTVSHNKNSYNDDYTMSFSDEYMNGSYSPNDIVQLPTNVRLVAQWEAIPVKPAKLKVTKLVTGPLGDKTKTFHFTYSYKDSNGEPKNGSFKLKNNGSYDFEGPLSSGMVVTITETDGEGYTTTYSIKNANSGDVDDTGSCKITLVPGDNEVTFTNFKNVNPDTGVLLDSMPYVIILIVVAAGIVGGVVLKKRKHGEDDV